MIIRRFPSGSFRWILPTLVVVLAALLGARVLVDWRSTRSASRHFAAPHAIVASTAPTHAPAATIPPPRHLTLADVPAPARWSRMMAISSLERLDFTIDLDRFAPLGDGPANAAIWFRDFANDDGSRAPEAGRSARMTVSLLGEEARVLAPDDPLLLEAEPWVDQATCRFYPDVWQYSGPDVIVPNLRFAIDLAKSWTARGMRERDPERARDDFRRAIRLGRLLMQDDLVMIQHLVGWACVSSGLRGLNDLARREGDAPTLAATTLALGDIEAMRQIAARWASAVSLEDAFHKRLCGWSVSFEDPMLERVIDRARRSPLRCMRVEALYPLDAIAHEGTRAQRKTAAAALADLTHDPDARLAKVATRLEQAPYVRSKYLSPPE